MKDGSIVAINYTGKIVVSGEVFESTIEKKAIEAGIFNEKQKYEPMVVVVGEGDVLKGLDKALKEMKVGEQRKVEVKPEEGWGPRKPGNISVLPLQQFKKEKMQPFPGLVVEINGRQGKVQTVSGGRVRVDFNHPLAGKDLLYELKVERELVEPKEQVESLYKKYFYIVPEKERKLAIGKSEVEVTLSPRWSANLAPLKQLFSRIVTQHVKGFSKVRFVEEFVEEKKEERKGEMEEKAKGIGETQEGMEEKKGENAVKGTVPEKKRGAAKEEGKKAGERK